jgi:hypothetical protein
MVTVEQAICAGAAEQPRVSRYVPMSFAQERFYFHEKLESLRGTYNVSVSFRLRGSLDVAGIKSK